MEIIKHGDKEQIRKAMEMIKFTCHKCGCVFNAGKHEYVFMGIGEYAGHMAGRYRSKCPDCKNPVYYLEE